MKSRIKSLGMILVGLLWLAGCGEISAPTAPLARLQVEDTNDLPEVIDLNHQDESVFPVNVLELSDSPGAAKLQSGLVQITDQTNRSILSITVTKNGQPVKNAMLYAMASVSGLGIYFPWSRTTDVNGQSTMAISAYGPVRGYFLIRAVDSATGEILGQWHSLPVNNKRAYVLDLRVGERGIIVSSTPLTDNVPLVLIKNVGKSHVLAADGSEEFTDEYDVQAVNNRVLMAAIPVDISPGLTDVKVYADPVQLGATASRYGANMFLLGSTLVIEKDSVVRLTFRARLRNADGSAPQSGTQLKIDWRAGNQNGLGIQSGIPVSTLPVSGTISTVK